MKEKLYTIPVNDAVNADDECPLCNAARALERDAVDYAIGPVASYMESDTREATDKIGFCRHHFKMMYDYGNSLGNALILSSHIKKIKADLTKQMNAYKPVLNKPFRKPEESNVETYLNTLQSRCYVCEYYAETYERYVATFFYLYEKDDDFARKIRDGKGFCLEHMNELLKVAPKHLKGDKLQEFTDMLFALQKKNLDRIQEDINWFVEKFKYENKDADWKNSRDAIPRSIQKIVGGYPADGPYKEPK